MVTAQGYWSRRTLATPHLLCFCLLEWSTFLKPDLGEEPWEALERAQQLGEGRADFGKFLTPKLL